MAYLRAPILQQQNHSDGECCSSVPGVLDMHGMSLYNVHVQIGQGEGLHPCPAVILAR